MNKKITDYAKEKYTYVVECPFCSRKTLEVNEIIYSLPGVGNVLLVAKKCSTCGYRHSDIFPLKKDKHKRIYIKVNSIEDLKTKILRSATSVIEIPEIDAEVTPGMIAPMFITNIEGLLQRFLDIIFTMKVLDIPDKDGRLKEIVRKIKEMKDGNIPFTVIIDDPWGISMVYEKSSETLVVTECVE